MASIAKPENSVAINDHANILKCKMHAYLAFGMMEDAEIYNSPGKIEDAIDPDNGLCKFVPLGDLAKDPIEWGWGRETEEVHAGKYRGLLTVEGSIKCINVGSAIVSLLDESGFEGECTLMFLPFKNPREEDVSADNPYFAVIVRGVSIIDNGKGNGNGKFGEVVLEYSAEANDIGDRILLLKYEAE